MLKSVINQLGDYLREHRTAIICLEDLSEKCAHVNLKYFRDDMYIIVSYNSHDVQYFESEIISIEKCDNYVIVNVKEVK